MPHQTIYEPAESAEQAQNGERASFVQRLWRNQLGILLAVALTFAAAVVLWMNHQG